MAAVTEASAGTGLRERKKERTRQALTEAALSLFASQGFEHTTVEEIAAACEVSPRTFFRYFATKEDVLFEDADARMQRLVDAIASQPPDASALGAMRGGILELSEEYERDRATIQARAQVFEATETLRVRKAERMGACEDALAQALADRTAAGGTTPFETRLVVAAAMAALRTSIDTWVADESADLRHCVETAFDALARGLDTRH